MVHLNPRNRLAPRELLEGDLHLHHLLARVGDPHFFSETHAIRWNVQHASVDEDMPMTHELARLLARRREAHAIDEIIETTLESDEQCLARHTRLLDRALEQIAELALREAVDPLHLLFFPQLLRVLRRLATPPGRLAVLARGVRAPFHRALFRQAACALEKELRPLAPAQPANGSRVACHASHPPFLGRAAPVVRNRRHVADRPDLQPGTRKRLNRGFATGAGTLHAHVYALHTQVQRLARRLLCRDSGGEGRRLLGALEPGLAGAAPSDRVALHIADRDERVVERRGNVRDALGLDDLFGALRGRACRCRFRLFGLFFWLFFLRLVVGHVPLLFQDGLLPARDGASRSLFGSRVRGPALSSYRQMLSFATTPIRPDVHQALDVHRDFGAERAFDLVVPFDDLPQPRHFGVAQVAHPRVRADAGLRDDPDR